MFTKQIRRQKGSHPRSRARRSSPIGHLNLIPSTLYEMQETVGPSSTTPKRALGGVEYSRHHLITFLKRSIP